ncbi:PREDICTED: tetranectin-like protein [Branchiostoma belcheri]|uniref:Tetranectin-like protein n=1 Tax=Branchiostoma belcheri TaxID=7741 RepID=A0A6P5A5J4_BRABE|nr:PREDICTED: tetranectin-like protein [Branchiostoma belcheri]
MSLATREPTDTSIGGWRPGQPSPRRRRNASLLESRSMHMGLECPKPDYDYFSHTGICYKSFAEEKTYDKAKQTCAADRGMLAMPKDDATNTFIYGLEYGDGDRWIGLSDAASEDNWVFEDGQTLASTGYNNWDQDEPSGGEGENCVVLRSENPTTWNDLGCNHNKRFICQLGKSAVASVFFF